MQNLLPASLIAASLVSYANLSGSTCEEPSTNCCLSKPTILNTSLTPFFEDWSQGIQPSRWYLYRKVFGSGNNGEVPELVSLETDNVDGVFKNVVVLTGQGNNTSSSILGIKNVNGQFVTGDSPQRVGAGITTADYFASGTYQVRMKIGSPNSAPGSAPVGLAPSIFTFHYEEHYPSSIDKGGTQLNPSDPQYQPRLKEGSKKTGYYSTVNSEIDCPEIGRNGDFTNAEYTCWTSELLSSSIVANLPSYGINILDGNYHTYTMVWTTQLLPTGLQDRQVKAQGSYFYAYDSPTSSIQGYPVVKIDGVWNRYAGKQASFFIDGIQVGSIMQNVSPVSARFTILSWFPSWAGIPNWDETKIYISEVSITPNPQPGDVLNEPESFPNYGLVPPPSNLYF